MIKAPDCQKRFKSAKARFLKGALNTFFQREFPKLIGPILRDKLIDELIKILDKMLPLKNHLKPGQIVWNAVDIRTRADSKNPKFVPVILTLISDEDTDKLAKGELLSKIKGNAIARIMEQAYEQGALLSMRDIGLFSWRYGGSVSQDRIKYEKEHEIVLPHTGSLQDMGSCISHKRVIIKKIIIDKKDPFRVAKETKHSIRAVDRYLKDYYRVKYCYDENKDIDFTEKVTGIRKFVVTEYLNIIENFHKKA